MKLKNTKAITYIPDGTEENSALNKTTYLCISAHQDDVELMAQSQINHCYYSKKDYFTAVNLTNGSGSPRTGEFASYTDEEMVLTRIEEQKEASVLGKYSALVMLMYPSKSVKDQSDRDVVEDLKAVILATKPKFILTHNLMDKHPTHVATCVRVLEALRELKNEYIPEKIIGLEVWRDLDWLSVKDKMLFDTSKNIKLAKKMLNVYKSQIAGGKRYDLAGIGRRYANATFFESHSTDEVKGLNYGVDMTEIVTNNVSYADFIEQKLNNTKLEMMENIKNYK